MKDTTESNIRRSLVYLRRTRVGLGDDKPELLAVIKEAESLLRPVYEEIKDYISSLPLKDCGCCGRKSSKLVLYRWWTKENGDSWGIDICRECGRRLRKSYDGIASSWTEQVMSLGYSVGKIKPRRLRYSRGSWFRYLDRLEKTK